MLRSLFCQERILNAKTVELELEMKAYIHYQLLDTNSFFSILSSVCKYSNYNFDTSQDKSR